MTTLGPSSCHTAFSIEASTSRCSSNSGPVFIAVTTNNLSRDATRRWAPHVHAARHAGSKPLLAPNGVTGRPRSMRSWSPWCEVFPSSGVSAQLRGKWLQCTTELPGPSAQCSIRIHDDDRCTTQRVLCARAEASQRLLTAWAGLSRLPISFRVRVDNSHSQALLVVGRMRPAIGRTPLVTFTTVRDVAQTESDVPGHFFRSASYPYLVGPIVPTSPRLAAGRPNSPAASPPPTPGGVAGHTPVSA